MVGIIGFDVLNFPLGRLLHGEDLVAVGSQYGHYLIQWAA
jgi:hypothetical protein